MQNGLTACCQAYEDKKRCSPHESKQANHKVRFKGYINLIPGSQMFL